MTNFKLMVAAAFVLASCFGPIPVRATDDATVGGTPTDLLPDKPLADGQTLLPSGWKVSPAGKGSQTGG